MKTALVALAFLFAATTYASNSNASTSIASDSQGRLLKVCKTEKLDNYLYASANSPDNQIARIVSVDKNGQTAGMMDADMGYDLSAFDCTVFDTSKLGVDN